MKKLLLEINNKYDSNIYICQCGWQECKPKHSYGPAVRDHYLIHFVREGQGRFYIEDRVYELKKNEGFLICPDDITYYEADEQNPWHYLWIGFNGIKASQYMKKAGLDKHNPIIRTEDSEFIINCLEEIFKSTRITHGSEVRMLGYLYLFLSKLIDEFESNDIPNHKEDYVHKAVEYIEMNYSRDIAIKNIAVYLGLNRNYFSRIFKESLNVSPQSFLIHYRVSKACELMKQYSNLSIGDISRSVGYTDQLTFSKIFKKIKGCSPRDYRLRISSTEK